MPGTPPCHDITVLYVEDDAATREQVARALGSVGYRLLIAENGAIGVEQYHAHKPDIILTDIMMPVMNGLEMARAIRHECATAQIIVMTAFSDTDYMTDAIDIGVNQFVLKPVDIQKLVAAIDRCINVVHLRKQYEILQEENIRAKKMEAVGILAGGMAHDFNNLLQVILGYVSLARMSAEPGSKTAEMLGIAEKTSETARELSKRLLSLAKGGGSLTQPMHLEPSIVSLVDTEIVKYPSICRIYNFQSDLPRVSVDAGQMQQVIRHITANACEAMPDGGTLEITMRVAEEQELSTLPLVPGNYLYIGFKDCGVGISQENLQKIFDPYFTTKEMGAQKGMGLGLAICHSIVKHHHGTITADSKPGQGTDFRIYLPITDSAS